MKTCLFICVLMGTLSDAQAGAAAPKALDCDVDCKKVTKQTSLALEYELCGLDEELVVADTDRRIVDRKSEDTLSPGGTCLARAFEAVPETRPWTVKVIVPPTSTGRRSSGQQIMSMNLSVLRSCLDFVGQGGQVPPAHRDVTRDVLDNLDARIQGGGNSGDRLMELAAEQADKYEWTNPAAHAQTRDDAPAGHDAIGLFSRYVQKVAGKIRNACCQRRADSAAYQLGYLLHAVQDLATHAGMTNAEHSYRLVRAPWNPDLDSTNLQRARDWTTRVLAVYAKSPSYGSCLIDAAKVSSTGANWNALARAGGYDGVDGNKRELLKFASGALQPSPPPIVRWFDQPNAGNADGWFDTNVLTSVKAATERPCGG
jgi:hypothetical protein